MEDWVCSKYRNPKGTGPLGGTGCSITSPSTAGCWPRKRVSALSRLSCTPWINHFQGFYPWWWHWPSRACSSFLGCYQDEGQLSILSTQGEAKARDIQVGNIRIHSMAWASFHSWVFFYLVGSKQIISRSNLLGPTSFHTHVGAYICIRVQAPLWSPTEVFSSWEQMPSSIC